MKKILFITLLIVHCSLFIAQAQRYDYDLTVKRGDYKELVFKHKGDVTAKILSFVVKLTKDQSSNRLVQKQNSLAGGDSTEISASYAASYTTITVKILSEDTRDLNARLYYYDIVSIEPTDSNKEVILFDGKFNIPWDVQGPFDGTALPNDGTRITTVSLANGNIDDELVLWDTTAKVWYPSGITYSSVAGANVSLNNLGTTSINTDLIPDKDNMYSIGDATTFWTGIYVSNVVLRSSGNFLTVYPNALSTNRTIYFPNASGTIALTSDLDSRQVSMGSDDNYVTDAEKTVIGNTSGINTGDNATNSQYSGLAASKQNTLVSGTNIKTINSQSILGSGNIVVAASDSGDTLTYTARELDSLAALAGTALQSSSSINPANITQSTSYRLVTDTEKSTWNAKLGTTDIQLFVDSVYRSNDTIYFKQKDGTRLFFVDQNTGGEGDTIPYTVQQIDSLLLLAGTSLQPGDAISDTTFTYQVLDSLGTRITELEGLLNSIIAAVEGCCDLTDNSPPAPATSYTAIGGTSETQYVATWTDPTTFDLDSLRWYEGSSADTATWTWYASINEGVQTYTRTGRTANTTYWSGVKAIDDSGNVGYFSNIDSALTLTAPGGSEQMETTRFLAALSTGLDAGTETAIDSFVVMLKDTFALDSLSQMFNAIYLYGIQTEEASLKNLVKRSHDITENGTDLIWTQNEGWVGDSTLEGTGYLDLNYNPATDTNNVAGRLSIGITTYVRSCNLVFEGPVWDACPLYGCNNGSDSWIELSVRRADDGVLYRISDNNWNGTLTNATGNVGVYTLSRIGDTKTIYKNSATFQTGTEVSTALPNFDMYAFGKNQNGTASGRTAPKQVSIMMIHRGLTLSEHQDLVTILEWWMDRWGKGVL